MMMMNENTKSELVRETRQYWQKSNTLLLPQTFTLLQTGEHL